MLVVRYFTHEIRLKVALSRENVMTGKVMHFATYFEDSVPGALSEIIRNCRRYRNPVVGFAAAAPPEIYWAEYQSVISMLGGGCTNYTDGRFLLGSLSDVEIQHPQKDPFWGHF